MPCLALPAPTHAFIGGSRGNIQEILKILLEKNSRVRVVINLAALESIGEALGCMEKFQFRDLEIIQVSVARQKSLAPIIF